MAKEVSLHMGSFLRKHILKNHIHQANLAKKLGISATSIARLYKRPGMNVNMLFTVCRTLQYNFFRDLANLLPPEMPPLTDNPLQKRVMELETENAALKQQVDLMKEILGVRK